MFLLIGVIGTLTNPSDDVDTAATSSSNGTTSSDTETIDKEDIDPTEVPIDYIAYDVSVMMDDLNSNALKAEKKYQDQYVQITVRLSNIDSDGKYIGLVPSDDEYAFIGVQCYIKSDEQTDRVMEMTIGDTVTIKGQITIIGEVLGYSLDIDEIN